MASVRGFTAAILAFPGRDFEGDARARPRHVDVMKTSRRHGTIGGRQSCVSRPALTPVTLCRCRQPFRFVAFPPLPVPTSFIPASDPAHRELLNREIGILAAQERVLAIAENPETPLLERLRYIAIVSSNLDEFFEIRVAGLQQQVLADGTLLPRAAVELQTIADRASKLIARQYTLLNSEILPAMRAQGIFLHRPDEWNLRQRRWMMQNAFFYRERESRGLLRAIL